MKTVIHRIRINLKKNLLKGGSYKVVIQKFLAVYIKIWQKNFILLVAGVNIMLTIFHLKIDNI